MILGMRIEVEFYGSECILIAETILGTLEAFFATVIEHRVVPHTELFRITVAQSDLVQEPLIQTSELDLSSTITWPRGLPVSRFEQQRDVRQFLAEVAVHVMGATCVVNDVNSLVDNLYTDGAVQQRIAMIAVAPNSYNRITSRGFARLSDWEEVVRQSYPLRDQRVELPRITLAHKIGGLDESNDVEGHIFDIKNHRSMGVSSVVDLRAWDQAGWRGCGYLQMGYLRSPYMALLFDDAAAARKIFERWRVRFGEVDASEEIAISIIRHLPEANPHHYCVQITSKYPRSSKDKVKKPVLATCSMAMEPANSENLDRFLAEYRRFGAYYLLPAVGMTNPEFFFDLMIMKRSLTVKSASEVCEHDIESLALRTRGLRVASQLTIEGVGRP
jgi:hypothetical protein